MSETGPYQHVGHRPEANGYVEDCPACYDEAGLSEQCPKGFARGAFSECFAPFRYCPEKGCGRGESDDLDVSGVPDAAGHTRPITPSETYHVFPTSDVVGHETDGSDCACGPRTEAVFREDGSNGWIVVHHRLAEA